jgi:hypothetical protein
MFHTGFIEERTRLLAYTGFIEERTRLLASASGMSKGCVENGKTKWGGRSANKNQ